jgi:hypothetical protein
LTTVLDEYEIPSHKRRVELEVKQFKIMLLRTVFGITQHPINIRGQNFNCNSCNKIYGIGSSHKRRVELEVKQFKIMLLRTVFGIIQHPKSIRGQNFNCILAIRFMALEATRCKKT